MLTRRLSSSPSSDAPPSVLLLSRRIVALPIPWSYGDCVCWRRKWNRSVTAAQRSEQDHYAVLGISRRASVAEVKRAYRFLARKYHPDVRRDSKSGELFKSIRLAYERKPSLCHSLSDRCCRLNLRARSMTASSLIDVVVFPRAPSAFPASHLRPPRWNPLAAGLLPKQPSTRDFCQNRAISLSTSNPCRPLILRASASPNTPSPSSPSSASSSMEGFLDAARRILGALRKPAVAALLIGLLLAVDPSGALAASGGRMGGRSFSSSSPSFSSSRSYSVSPGSSFSYSAPYYYAPSPFFGGGGLYLGFGAGSSFLVLLMSFAAFILLSGFLSDRSDDGSVLTATSKTSVLKLQVGLLGLARSFQRDLDRIAENADTSTPEGLSYVLSETTLALLRHPDCCVSGYSSVDVKKSVEDGEKRFNQLSIEERGKFDEETLVNVNSIKRRSIGSSRSSTFSNEYIVITILVAAEGTHKLPVINGSSNLKEALQSLASIPSSRLMAVEVLWTPQNEGDTLSERELLEDYPLLRPL